MSDRPSKPAEEVARMQEQMGNMSRKMEKPRKNKETLSFPDPSRAISRACFISCGWVTLFYFFACSCNFFKLFFVIFIKNWTF